ncbi:MAG: hypothetical protein CVU11_07275 [Bacteroidetes bacterium HGW-Bacteroidetes-6]|nr:MAG: hypothetical protein CVU11_07275 [Bacteroidetes bacterium HGW-Bacteroidetes-6]
MTESIGFLFKNVVIQSLSKDGKEETPQITYILTHKSYIPLSVLRTGLLNVTDRLRFNVVIQSVSKDGEQIPEDN